MITIDSTRCINCGSCIRSCCMGVLGQGETTPQVLPRRRCIACMHCVAACPQKAVLFDDRSGQSGDAYCIQAPASEIERQLVSRRSVRHYRDQLPPKELLQWALDRANYAPSGKNIHANRWTVLYGAQATQALVETLLDWCDAHGEAPELRKLMNKGTNLLTCGAPCVLLGWSPDDCLNPVVDTAVAMTTVELLLVSRGLSTCWGGYIVQIMEADPALRQRVGIPAGCNIRCALMIGYAAGERYPNIPVRPAAQPLWMEEFS